MIYEFCWEDENLALMDIDVEKEQVKALLDEYRSKNEYYNIDGWADFLRNRGITARVIEPDVCLHF